MVHHATNSFCLALLCLCAVTAADAGVIALWNFNSNPPDSNTATGTTNPSFGTGAASLLGGVTQEFVSGSPNDPGSDNSGWNILVFPDQGTGNKRAGVQ